MSNAQLVRKVYLLVNLFTINPTYKYHNLLMVIGYIT